MNGVEEIGPRMPSRALLYETKVPYVRSPLYDEMPAPRRFAERGGRLPKPESVESLSDKVQLPGAGYSLGAAACPQLAVQAVDVRLDGARRNEELGCDLLVGLAHGDEREHLQLSLAQWLGEPLLGSRRCGLLCNGR
jgi:hypothetical protein